VDCYLIPGLVLLFNPGMEQYDIRMKCPDFYEHDCYNFTAATMWLRTDETKKFLNASGRDWVENGFQFGIESWFNGDGEESFRFELLKVLKIGGRVLIYNGEYDLFCNWIGSLDWMNDFQWPGQVEFQKASYKEWRVGGKTAGWLKSTNDLQFQFLKFANSGHLVPHDQPMISLQMFNLFLHNQTFPAIGSQ